MEKRESQYKRECHVISKSEKSPKMMEG